jgi:hypothetical protein
MLFSPPFPLPLIEPRRFRLIRQQRLSRSYTNEDYRGDVGSGHCEVVVEKMILATVQTLRCSCCPKQESAYFLVI